MSFFDALCIQAAETVEKRINEEGNQADKPRMSVDGKEAAAKTGAENVVPESMAGGEKTAGQAGSQNQSAGLNPEQEQAVRAVGSAIAVVAGPGTGKTKTLIARILHMLEVRKVKPS